MKDKVIENMFNFFSRLGLRRPEKKAAPVKEVATDKKTPQKKHKTRRRRGKTINTFIRGNRKIPDRFRAYADYHRHPDCETEWEAFINYWESEGKTKIDWLATWRNRVLASKKHGWYYAKPEYRRENFFGDL